MSATVETGAVPSPQPLAVPVAVSLAHVNKSFHLPHERYHTLKERALRAFRPQRYDELHALRDVTVDIAQGEFFGIVGRNGSGKSTLLKCLAGIYAVDSGQFEIAGRLSPFIELGVGFNPELTARDNVIINAVMLGLSRKEAHERFDDIVAFAELEGYMDLKLKNYSSGMQVRLAFAVAIQVDAEILLIDEVLAVGDAAFQQKCYDQFLSLKRAGRTLLFVTHDMGAVARFCDRAMLLERGRVVDIGDPEAIASQYNDLNFKSMRHEAVEMAGPEKEAGNRVAALAGARFEREDGEPQYECEQGETCWIRMDVFFYTDATDPIFAFTLRDDRDAIAFAASTQLTYGRTGRFQARHTVTIRMRFENWLAPGRYRLLASVARDGSPVIPYHALEDISSIFVYANRSGGGAVDLPNEFEIEEPRLYTGPL